MKDLILESMQAYVQRDSDDLRELCVAMSQGVMNESMNKVQLARIVLNYARTRTEIIGISEAVIVATAEKEDSQLLEILRGKKMQ